MKNVGNLINIELVSNIEYQKKIFFQRNLFLFEFRYHENIVFEKQSIFIRDKTADQSERAGTGTETKTKL